tara:strand:- start:24018 stop:24311 length:294 start_codon:yes stop_codon:yes gene_type:complete
MSRQVNNPTSWNKNRPNIWRNDQSIAAYLQEIENWARQVYERLTGIHEQSSYTVATLPNATEFEAHTIYVSDEAGGATIAFSDGTNWRRVQDRAVVS